MGAIFQSVSTIKGSYSQYAGSNGGTMLWITGLG